MNDNTAITIRFCIVMAVLSLMHSIFPRNEFFEKCRKMYGFTLEKCRNCSAPGVEGRGGEVKK